MRLVLFTLRQIGIDPIKLLKFVRNLPKFLKTLLIFSWQNGFSKIRIAPVLSDFSEEGGSASGHYFWQDLLCAKWVFASNPTNHLDVGSRVDGFVAHLLTFRTVDILDIRPISSTVPGLRNQLGDAQLPLRKFHKLYESVSSLHAIEHFGLGRYGDRIDKLGHKRGLMNIAACVDVGGDFYVSFPIGKPRIEFNAQRVLDPCWPVEELSNFKLIEFVLIPWKSEPVFGLLPSMVDLNQKGNAGLYWFKRKH